eukprot:TRINITY_DN44705_c0_g1_i1.p1 TRINITY_DN44705_c0_g1~~TRINITY_DN44705_c0_g1_i1.p1  ORF type:complete len:283 (+),score=29.13 TRINITY_DN44705_c0_g1_i1:156-1004(+)
MLRSHRYLSSLTHGRPTASVSIQNTQCQQVQGACMHDTGLLSTAVCGIPAPVGASRMLTPTALRAAAPLSPTGRVSSATAHTIRSPSAHRPCHRSLAAVSTAPWLSVARRQLLIDSDDASLNAIHAHLPHTDPAWRAGHLFFGTLHPSGADSVEGTIALPDVQLFVDRTAGKLVARFSIGTPVTGNVDVVHGGLLMTLLDEMMGLLLYHLGLAPAATASLTTQFRRVVRPNSTVYGAASVTSVEGRKRQLSAALYESLDPLTPVTEASALFIKLRGSHDPCA